MKEKALNWSTLGLTLAKEGYVVVPGLLNRDQLGAYRSLADKTILADRADYPGSDRDVGFVNFKDTQGHDLLRNPPLHEVLMRLLGERLVFINAWVRVSLPNFLGSSPGCAGVAGRV